MLNRKKVKALQIWQCTDSKMLGKSKYHHSSFSCRVSCDSFLVKDFLYKEEYISYHCFFEDRMLFRKKNANINAVNINFFPTTDRSIIISAQWLKLVLNIYNHFFADCTLWGQESIPFKWAHILQFKIFIACSYTTILLELYTQLLRKVVEKKYKSVRDNVEMKSGISSIHFNNK